MSDGSIPVTDTEEHDEYNIKGPCFLSLTGEFEPAFDPVVINLAGKIEEVFEQFFTACDKDSNISIEVEGRLGTIKDGERLKLPIESEAVLDPPSEPFPYKFEAGINQFRFQRLLEAVHEALQIPPEEKVFDLPADTLVFNTDPIQKIQTDDEFRSVSATVFERLNIPGDDEFAPRRIRSSFIRPKTANATPHEHIWKRRVHTLNIYTGCNINEDVDLDESAPLDIRVGINVEYTLPLSLLQDSPPDMVRHRERVSYPLRNKYRLDATVVKQTTSRTSRYNEQVEPSYEIEIEMNPERLIKEIQKKQSGQPHNLFRLVKDFLGILRDFSSFLNSKNTLSSCPKKRSSKRSSTEMQAYPKNQDLANLTDCAQSEEALNNYTTYVSPVVPLIGDYLFRGVASYRKSVLPCDLLSSNDIEQSTKIMLTEKEVQMLRQAHEE